MNIQESKIERYLTRGVKALGGRSYKWVSPGNTGVPDRIVILKNAGVIFIELKTEHGRLSPMQKSQLKRLKRLGQRATVLYGMADVDEFLAWAEEKESDEHVRK